MAKWKIGQRVGVGLIAGEDGICEPCKRGDMVNCHNPVTLGNILGLFLREAAMLLFVGLAIGIPVALIASRLVSGMLFSVSPSSPVSIVVPSAVLIFAGLLAGLCEVLSW